MKDLEKLLIFNDKNFVSHPLSSLTSIIMLWNTSLYHTLVFKILRSFNFSNKCYLKNILFKFLKDPFILKQFDKMLNTCIIGISGSLIYNTVSNFWNSNLSSFLLNLYLMEFDFYLEKFVFKYNFFKNFEFNPRLFNDNFFYYLNILSIFMPVKSNQKLFKFCKLKLLVFAKHYQFSDYFLNSCLKNFSIIPNYEVYISCFRYLDSFILGCKTSIIFVSFLIKKLQNFLQVRIKFNIKELTIFNLEENNTLFLCYKIILLKNSVNSRFNNIYNDKLYFSKSFFRILKSQKLFSDILLKRFRLEFGSNIKYIFDKHLKTLHYVQNFCHLIFQLEAVSASKINKLIDQNIVKEFISNNVLNNSRRSSNNLYCKYLFSICITTYFLMLRNISEKILPKLLFGSLSNDFFLYNYFLELKKNITLQKHITTLNLFYFKSNKYILNLFYFNKINICTKNSTIVRSNIFNYSIFFKNYYLNIKKSFFFHVPFNFLTKKLRLLGFLHSFKNRSVGNLSLVYFSDYFIIKISSYIVYAILSWFSLCKDFNRLRFFVELIRESCLLTLCRKHNKTRSWIYNIYTFDLILFKNLYLTNFFFPTKKFVRNFSDKKYFLQNNLALEEGLFF